MGLKDILKKIEEDGEKRLKEISKEWDEKISQEKAKIDKKVEEYYKENLIQMKKSIDQEQLKKVLDAKLEQRTKILEKKRELIEKIFNEVFNEFKKLDDKDYYEILKQLIKSAEDENFNEILLNERDLKKFKKNIEKDFKNLKVVSQPVNISGGVILRKGKIEINLSFDFIFKDKREKLELEVGKIIHVI